MKRLVENGPPIKIVNCTYTDKNGKHRNRKHDPCCQQCGKTTYVMLFLKDELWKLLTPDGSLEGYYCATCIFDALERPLAFEDLKIHDLNEIAVLLLSQQQKKPNENTKEKIERGS